MQQLHHRGWTVVNIEMRRECRDTRRLPHRPYQGSASVSSSALRHWTPLPRPPLAVLSRLPLPHCRPGPIRLWRRCRCSRCRLSPGPGARRVCTALSWALCVCVQRERTRLRERAVTLSQFLSLFNRNIKIQDGECRNQTCFISIVLLTRGARTAIARTL